MVRVTTQPIFAFTPPIAVPRPFGLAGPGSPRTFDFLPDGRIIGVGATAQVRAARRACHRYMWW